MPASYPIPRENLISSMHGEPLVETIAGSVAAAAAAAEGARGLLRHSRARRVAVEQMPVGCSFFETPEYCNGVRPNPRTNRLIESAIGRVILEVERARACCPRDYR